MMDAVIRVDPEIMGGVPCFAGTRVPAASLFARLKLGYSVDQFIGQFPTVRKEQVGILLEKANRDERNWQI